MDTIAHVGTVGTETGVLIAKLGDANKRIGYLETQNRRLQQALQEERKRRSWTERIEALPQETLSVSKKATLKSTMRYLRSKQADQDGYYKVEPWRIGQFAGQSDQTVRDNLAYCSNLHSGKLTLAGPLPLFEKKIVKTPDDSKPSGFREETYLRPNELLYRPYQYHVSEPIRHGGSRLHCNNPECPVPGGSERLQKKVTKRVIITCMDCGNVLSDEETNDTTMLNDDPEPQGNDQARADEVTKQEAPDNQEPDEQDEAQPGPQSQLDFDERGRLTEVNLTENPSTSLPSQVDFEPAPTDSKPLTTPPATVDPYSVLATWLQRRIGDGTMVYATGLLTSNDKYLPYRGSISFAAYLDGRRGHIYGSRLRNEQGLTRVLSVDLDKPAHFSRWRAIVTELAQAGVSPICWLRQRDRAHIELYMDQNIDPDAGRAWCVAHSPTLAQLHDEIEWFPGPGRYKHALSWPLRQRIGDEIFVCTGYAMLASRPGELIQVSVEDRQALAALIVQAVTPAAPILALAAQVREQETQPRSVAQQQEQRAGEQRHIQSGERQAVRQRGPAGASSNRDLAKQVIEEFCAGHDWNEIANLCGGMKNGRFRAKWRDEETPSVVPDANGKSNYARDYGATGSSPSKLDRYEAWCLVKGIDKRTDLGERIAALRAQLLEQERASAAIDVQLPDAPPAPAEERRQLSYNEMCDEIEKWGARHEHPAVETSVEGRIVRIEAGKREWSRWLLLGLASRDERKAMYLHLVQLE
jgi:hypothetical protein